MKCFRFLLQVNVDNWREVKEGLNDPLVVPLTTEECEDVCGSEIILALDQAITLFLQNEPDSILGNKYKILRDVRL